jgi:hypothetical protein
MLVLVQPGGTTADPLFYAAWKPTRRWLPSQNGLAAEWPQRQSLVAVTRATARPVPAQISRLPVTAARRARSVSRDRR